MDTLIWMIFSILGAASIAGGIVIYSKSKGSCARALGTASAAAGIVMLGIVLVTLPVSQTKKWDARTHSLLSGAPVR